MDDAINQALDAWIKFRNESPDYYLPDKSEAGVAWSDLDDSMLILDEAFSEHQAAARAGGQADG